MSSYKENVWTDSPESEITAEKFNNQETGIKQAHDGDNTPIFDSYDVQEDEEMRLDTEWENVQGLWSGETMKSILMKISLFFRNVRYLYKKLNPQFAYLSLSTATSVDATTDIPFDSYVIEGSAFSVENGVVTVEEEMEFVRISTTIGGGTSSDAQSRVWARIMRNGSIICDSLAYATYVSTSCYTIARAQKGDKFSVRTAQKFTAEGGGVGCYFQIEKVC